MASVWFTVVILVLIQQVIATYRECAEFQNLKNCNDCIRCGGHWCNDPNEVQRCSRDTPDTWCQGNREKLLTSTKVEEQGILLSPKYILQTLEVGNRASLNFTFPSKTSEQKVEYVVNSTQNSDFQVTKQTYCQGETCTTTIEAAPETTFCGADGKTYEFFNVKVSVGGIEDSSVIKFHVPCACGCSDAVEAQSPRCNRRGSFSCGVCTCHAGWIGTFCEQPICEKKRGDVPCTDSARSNTECSGNGVCGPCDQCECFTDKEGSRYFDQDNYCADICMTTNYCDQCLASPLPGQCQDCHFPLYRLPYNQTLMTYKDDFNRKLWIKCNSTINDCNIEYAAMRDNNGETFYMIMSSCDPVAGEQVVGGVSVTLPVVLGVIAMLAVAAATAGYVIWKNRTPPMPLTDPMYQNIDAEDCTGENPLYKPPTSSFKNPTYGKW
ncbi:jg13179 [Pararge aegeria aegeria]|uniref:Jg13179 protein n=1 Tax=Pararge aegeria aegeria TaxID=348720 RepID=A0A8S4RAG7_9NEOP|nr:jg13179 [Pararge aegeria aegeria]